MQGTVGESAQQQSSDVFSFQTAVLEWGKKKKENYSLELVREVCNSLGCSVILRFGSPLHGDRCAIKSSHFGSWRWG